MKDMLNQPHEPSSARNPGNVLPLATLAAFETLQRKEIYSEGHLFFARGQSPSGIYLLHAGRARLFVDSGNEKFVLRFAMPGDMLGLSAVVSGAGYEVTAEAMIPCRAGFIKGPEFLHFVSQHPEAAFWTVCLLSQQVTAAFARLSFLRGPADNLSTSPSG